MSFDHDIAVVGAGRIGLPWAAVIAATQERSVTCIDIDEERVRKINAGISPFREPELDQYIQAGIEANRLQARNDPKSIPEHKYIAFAINAPRNDMSGYIDTIGEYARSLDDGQTVILRTTLPIDMVSKTRDIITGTDADINFAVFPERLAEGKAIEEIQTLPKVVGVDHGPGERAVRDLLEPFDCPLQITDPETAMLVKLIDNSYRDALFAIANQIAYTADQLGLNAHDAIEIANFEYPRNEIPTPGTVGGKCLPKDPHFLTDERVCDQPTTPDLFNTTRRTNAYLPSYIVTEILQKQPSEVAVLGLAYKRGVGDTFASPAVAIADSLESQGVPIRAFDPNIPDYEDSIEDALRGAEGAVLAVNHGEFLGTEEVINDYIPEEGFVYDIWGILDRKKLTPTVDGLGITPQ
jgi:UDP-N-acetyl-D-mannosaminuronic acid dehydrogenase